MKQAKSSNTSFSELKSEFQEFLDHIVDGSKNVYNAVLLVESPQIKWKGARGMADPDGKVPMVADDQFFTASTAKMMTATLAMMLVERGHINLDDKIQYYLSESIMNGLHEYQGQSYEDRICIRHLLNHTSGLGDNWSDPRFMQQIIEEPDRFWNPEETIQYVKQNILPHFPPGHDFRYSDINYNLVGLIIETVTEMQLHRVYRELLLDTLGMNHTYRPFYEEPRPSIAGRLPSHCFAGDLDYTGFRSLSADWAGGGLQTTTEDLNRFIQAFAKNTIFTNPSTRDEMLKGIKIDEGTYYGLGVVRCVFDELKEPKFAGLGEIWGHQGASGSFMYYWLDEDVSICGTLNQEECQGRIGEIVADIMMMIREWSKELH